MAHTIEQIAAAIGAEAHGAAQVAVTGAAEPADARADELALAMKPEYAENLAAGAARAAILWEGADWQALGLEAAILVARPRYSMAGVTRLMDPGPGWDPGIHPTAVIADGAELGADVAVGPLAVIGAGARIGAGTVIGPHATVGAGAEIGAGGCLREGVRICARVRIGARFIAQPGVVVGGDGFSFVTPETSGVERVRESLGAEGATEAQSYVRIHSLGAVRIGDDVEIGANSCVDRGTIRDTVIGNGTKLDNHVQIGHNCVIGNDGLLCGQVGLAGSVTVGNNVVLAGKTGASDNIFIGDNVITGGASKLFTNVPAGRVMLGHPATKMEAQMEIYKGLRRLRRLFDDVAELKKTVSNRARAD